MSSVQARVKRIPLSRAVLGIALASLATAIMITGLLWAQMANGNDPALGPKITKAPKPRSQSRPALPRIVYEDDDGATLIAPRAVAPPSVAPAPAPPPAPVQTTTS